MEQRALGNSGLKIAPLVFGGNVFGWTADERRSFELLDAFTDAGLNLIDTADVYSSWAPGNQGGESEAIIGLWLRKTGKRSRVLIATKAGHPMAGELKGLRAPNILRAVEGSLRRLQTDVIDLYQAHVDDPETPVEETLGAFSRLIEQGKVRAIGASQITAERIEESLETSRRLGLASYSCLQPLYNLYDRAAFETRLAPVCRRHGLGVIPYYALAAGFLTGKYRSAADLGKSVRGHQRVQASYLNPRGLRIIEALERVAVRFHAPLASVALAWILTNPDVTAPIASATSVEQLQDLIRGAELRLDEAARSELNAASTEDPGEA
jgi:aryl-alcohol dehydrogenase-like predicted oxidoreductase